MELTPDSIVYWSRGPIVVNATLVVTWGVMAVLVAASAWATRAIEPGETPGRRQAMLEIVVGEIRSQIREATGQDPNRYLPFVGTLFLLITVSNVSGVLPGVVAPTGSLSTASALAACVFLAVPIYGIAYEGAREYFARYLRPTPFMLPFHVIGELSRTLALAVRLFGNIVSGTLIVAILVSLAPLVLPVLMQAFGILIGLVQAYVFAVLALVYIASAVRVSATGPEKGRNDG